MSHLAPHFDPDVFVSYSHGDPIAGEAPLRDWTRALIHRLRVGLHALKTEFDGLDIWMDPDIDPTAFLTPELKAKAGACGVLMIVMSERYLKSSWCGDELKWFREQFEGRASEGGRVFVIRAQQTEERLWPDFLRDARGHALIGFPFYDPENGDPWGFQLREPGDEYFKELTHLRTWLTRRLRELRERAARRAEAEAVAVSARDAVNPAGPRLVYLHAPVGCEIRARRRRRCAQDRRHRAADRAEPQRSGKPLRLAARSRTSGSTMARQCEAHDAAACRRPGRFADDLFGIGVDERKEHVERSRRAAALCGARQDRRELADRRALFGIEPLRPQSDRLAQPVPRLA